MDLVLCRNGSWQHNAIGQEIVLMAAYSDSPERIKALCEGLKTSGTQVTLILDDLIWIMNEVLVTLHGLDVALIVERQQAWQGSPEIRAIEYRVYGLSQLLAYVSGARYAGDNLTVKVQ